MCTYTNCTSLCTETQRLYGFSRCPVVQASNLLNQIGDPHRWRDCRLLHTSPRRSEAVSATVCFRLPPSTERGNAAPHPALRFRPPETGRLRGWRSQPGALGPAATRLLRMRHFVRLTAGWLATRRVPPALARGLLAASGQKIGSSFLAGPGIGTTCHRTDTGPTVTAIPCGTPSALALRRTGPVP